MPKAEKIEWASVAVLAVIVALAVVATVHFW
jgi:hypothetical protein